MFPTRLFYGGRAGFASLDGRRVELADSPVLLGQRVFQIDFVPGISYSIRRTPSSEAAEMTAAEVAAALALLYALCAPRRKKP